MLDTFASRVTFLESEGAYAVLARAKALEAQGRNIIHLEIGQPDFPTPAHVAQAGADAILGGHTRYTPPAGALELRAAIAEAAGRQRGMQFSPEEVVVGPGAKPAIFFSALALLEPGDEVIMPDPGFPSYAATIKVTGAVPVPVRLHEMRSLDLDELRAHLSPRTRLILLNSPSNPTGGVTTQAELEQIAGLARRANIWVLSDEIYSQLVFEGSAPSIADLPGMRERTIIVDGFSKTYAMTGWRLGYGIMPKKLAERVELLLTHSVGCTADFSQVAAIAALRGDQDTVRAMCDSFHERRDRLVPLLNRLPGVRCALPQGAFYVFPDVSSYGRSSKQLADYLLDQAGVALLAGSDFGRGGEGYLRISYATAWEKIEEGVERIRQALAPVSSNPLPARRILGTWWPLAASWVLMSAELPMVSAVVARLAQPEINLAAYGGVVYPLALIIESPIIMLLAASTALSKDWASYRKLRRFMMIAGALLTVLHLLIALTPAYYVVVSGLIGAPAEIVEPARIGLIIMTPWTWAIAYRRFNQGVMIRFGHSRAVGTGTVVRLTAEVAVLAGAYLAGRVPGIVVAASAIIAGVLAEAVYAGLRVREVIELQVKTSEPIRPGLTFPTFLHFYIPLVMTSLLSLLAQPIGSSAISRMPDALSSLAVWPVVTGLIFLLRSFGVAYNEVVVALLDRPGAVASLRRFALWMAGLTTLALLVITATPLSTFWFLRISALPPALATLAQRGLWVGFLLPALSVFQSWFQGAILHSRRTSGISEAVVVYLVVSVATLVAGVLFGRAGGLYIGLAALLTGTLAQTAWLWLRSRPAIRAAEEVASVS